MGVALRRLIGAVYGATNLPALRLARSGKAPARGDGQALALAASPCSRAGGLSLEEARHSHSGCNVSLPVGWRGNDETARFMVPSPSPPRGQREVAKRQPAATGRRSQFRRNDARAPPPRLSRLTPLLARPHGR